MSDFLAPGLAGLSPYVPGEQPQDRQYIKLNTNESPFPPSPRVAEALGREEVSRLNLYSDPTALPLRRAIADACGVTPDHVFCGNGSDEVLAFSFLAFAGEGRPVTYPQVSYGLYSVLARLFRTPGRAVPLRGDFTLPADRFVGANGMVVLANPNAPTGIALPLKDVERIVRGNPRHIVLVDEAYVDFGGQSALPLLKTCRNLLVVRTFSKSRSLAGARLGYAIADPPVIGDLNRVRCSFHPYSVNRLSMLAGVEAMRDAAYFERCVQSVVAQRAETARELKALGFGMTPSSANFLFAAHPALSAREYYLALKARGVLVRCWDDPNLKEHVRITIGARGQMRRLALETRAILDERKLL